MPRTFHYAGFAPAWALARVGKRGMLPQQAWTEPGSPGTLRNGDTVPIKPIPDVHSLGSLTLDLLTSLGAEG